MNEPKVYGNDNSESNARTKANALAYLSNSKHGVEVEFYQAESAPVWASQARQQRRSLRRAC